jgi:pimeloyl-ACP methyl ester carboxylesterase
LDRIHHISRGEGVPLLFQHGLGANISQVTGLLEEFADIQLITADMRGHGGTPWDPERLPSFDSYTDDLVRLLDFLRIDRVIMGGISMGAGLTLNMASRYPDRVQSMILVRPAWLMEGAPKNLCDLLDIAALLPYPDGQETFEGKPGFIEIQRNVPNAASSVLGMFDRDQQDHTPELLQAMVNDTPVTEAPSKPALILGNDSDPLHPWAMAEQWHAMLPVSEIYKIPSRYVDPEGHATALNQHIKEFLNQQIN